MKIGGIGAGMVGGGLGKRFAAAGHDIVYGVREPDQEKYAGLIEESGNGARAAVIVDAITHGEAVVLAVPWEAVEESIRLGSDWSGKLILDATNAIVRGPDGRRIDAGLSGGEQVAEWAPEAKVVKIFNSTGFNVMEDPSFPDGAATILYCGDDEESKATAAGLAVEIGFEALDCGRLSSSALLEQMAMLWVWLARIHGRELAFRVLRR